MSRRLGGMSRAIRLDSRVAQALMGTSVRCRRKKVDPTGMFFVGPRGNARGDGTVKCDHGAWKPIVNVPPPYNTCPIFGICATLHEMSHIRDADLLSPGICTIASSHDGYLIPSNSSETKTTSGPTTRSLPCTCASKTGAAQWMLVGFVLDLTSWSELAGVAARPGRH